MRWWLIGCRLINGSQIGRRIRAGKTFEEVLPSGEGEDEKWIEGDVDIYGLKWLWLKGESGLKGEMSKNKKDTALCVEYMTRSGA